LSLEGNMYNDLAYTTAKLMKIRHRITQKSITSLACL